MSSRPQGTQPLDPPQAPLGLALLGSTGSIGRNVLRVVRHFPGRFSLVSLAAFGSRLEALAGQVREFRPKIVAVREPEAAERLAAELPPGVRVLSGEEGVISAATHPQVRRVVAAMVGAAGLKPVWAALELGTEVALANKEALVAAGPLLTRLAAERGATIIPIDSEHVALHQALRSGRSHEVRRLVLTASGGPFLHRERSTWDRIRPAEALAHPTWEMGAKITIDSATLMNKGLELIEACHLFAHPPHEIDVVVHPQSIVHSLVEFRDGSVMAQMSANDMIFPIQYALSFPERWENRFPRLSLEQLGSLQFLPLDSDKFPSVGLARHALSAGASAPAVLNAANEVAVRAFLAGRISFPEITTTVEQVLDRHRAVPVESLDEALGWDEWGRRKATAVCEAN